MDEEWQKVSVGACTLKVFFRRPFADWACHACGKSCRTLRGNFSGYCGTLRRDPRLRASTTDTRMQISTDTLRCRYSLTIDFLIPCKLPPRQASKTILPRLCDSAPFSLCSIALVSIWRVAVLVLSNKAVSTPNRFVHRARAREGGWPQPRPHFLVPEILAPLGEARHVTDGWALVSS